MAPAGKLQGISLIVRSREPFNTWWPEAENFTRVNVVGIYSEPEDTLRAFRSGIMQCNTSHAIFIDDDDPFPKGIKIPTHPLLIGNEIRDSSLWDKSLWGLGNLCTPIGIHKCVFSVLHAKQVLSLIPEEPLYPEWIVFSSMALAWGYEYDSEFVYTWRKTSGNQHHTQVGDLVLNTQKFITAHQAAIVAQLRRTKMQ